MDRVVLGADCTIYIHTKIWFLRVLGEDAGKDERRWMGKSRVVFATYITPQVRFLPSFGWPWYLLFFGTGDMRNTYYNDSQGLIASSNIPLQMINQVIYHTLTLNLVRESRAIF